MKTLAMELLSVLKMLVENGTVLSSGGEIRTSQDELDIFGQCSLLTSHPHVLRYCQLLELVNKWTPLNIVDCTSDVCITTPRRQRNPLAPVLRFRGSPLFNSRLRSKMGRIFFDISLVTDDKILKAFAVLVLQSTNWERRRKRHRRN